MYADLTPLVQHWDQFHASRKALIREGTINGHIYTVSGHELSALVIRYRKDWFREAGILNEKGEPGPPTELDMGRFSPHRQKIDRPGARTLRFRRADG